MRIKEYRIQKGFKLNEFARTLGLAPSYLCALELGRKKNPSKEVMDKIASALGKSVPEVFYEERGIM